MPQAYFTFAKQIFHIEDISLVPLGTNFIENDLVFRQGLFLDMGYKKDSFGSFAYEFELLRFLVKSFACAHDEIIYSVNCEI